jgi:hypothetical protein
MRNVNRVLKVHSITYMHVSWVFIRLTKAFHGHYVADTCCLNKIAGRRISFLSLAAHSVLNIFVIIGLLTIYFIRVCKVIGFGF